MAAAAADYRAAPQRAAARAVGCRAAPTGPAVATVRVRPCAVMSIRMINAAPRVRAAEGAEGVARLMGCRRAARAAMRQWGHAAPVVHRVERMRGLLRGRAAAAAQLI